MQILISIMIIGLLWMIYDLINAPEVDEDENYVSPSSDDTSEEDIQEIAADTSKTNREKNISEID